MKDLLAKILIPGLTVCKPCLPLSIEYCISAIAWHTPLLPMLPFGPCVMCRKESQPDLEQARWGWKTGAALVERKKKKEKEENRDGGHRDEA